MERYLILVIVVAVIGVTTQKKDGQCANFRERIIPSITTSEKSEDPIDISTSYTQFKPAAGVIHEKKTYEDLVYRNSIRKMIKNWHSHQDKMSGSTNPRILYNILRTLPMGEPYFIE